MWRLRGKVVWSIVGILCYIFIYYFVEALLRWSVGIAERLPGLFLVFYAAARLPPTLAVSGKYGEAEQASGWTCQLVPPCPAPRHASKPTIDRQGAMGQSPITPLRLEILLHPCTQHCYGLGLAPRLSRH